VAPYQIVTIAIRLFAIWLAVYVARAAPAFFMETRRYDDEVALWMAIAIAIVSIALVLVLWFFPRTVARSLLPDIAVAEPVATSPDDWLPVGCSLLGLWLLSLAIPGLIRYLIILYIGHRTTEDISYDGGIYATLIYYIVQVGIGLWLVFGARGLKRLLVWARHAGRE
jgi:hypothetical protein